MAPSLVRVAACALCQWALDFDGNRHRIAASIRAAKRHGARYRVGPELEITGYGAYDAFLEPDTEQHAFEVLAALLADDDLTCGIVCDVGLPVVHRGVRYNCRALLLDRRVVWIRPKQCLAVGGNYRESRWFAAWPHGRPLELFPLPAAVARICGQTSVPFGDALLVGRDATIAVEACEELFTVRAPNTEYWLAGADIVANASASHHELRKLRTRIELIRAATAKYGGAYAYANQCGCDGDRLYYDGAPLVCVNGEVVAQGRQFSLADVELVTAVIDLDAVRSFRAAQLSSAVQAAAAVCAQPPPLERIVVGFTFAEPPDPAARWPIQSPPLEPSYHAPEDEIRLGPACWLWDYLRRSGASGFFIPFSGGIDSAAVSCIVASMCRLVCDSIAAGDAQVRADAARIVGADADAVLSDPRRLANALLHTCYMGTAQSSADTRSRARRLAAAIGNYHVDLDMDAIVRAIVDVFAAVFGRTPVFRVHGGTQAENLALQNVQARLRMLLSYLMAQLLCWVRGRSGWLLVLGTANVDESLRGYFTKYDCSSADLNPIGSISKRDLRRFLTLCRSHFDWPVLQEFLDAVPTAELEPITSAYTQTDEADMGMTYDELSLYGQLRKVRRLGPVSMLEHLLRLWPHLTPTAVADKVKHFFRTYAANRHKMTTLTPAYHAEAYSPDDNRFDLRQFLYRTDWPWQFAAIDARVLESDAARAAGDASVA